MGAHAAALRLLIVLLHAAVDLPPKLAEFIRTWAGLTLDAKQSS